MKIEEKYIDRFWLKVKKTKYCWNWTGAIWGGYGSFRYPIKPYHTEAHIKII